MKNIAMIYIILSFFVYIISCSIIYMIIKDMINIRFNKKVEKLESTFGKVILRQLKEIESNKNISKVNIDYVKEHLRKKHYIKVFNNIIIKFNENESNHKLTKVYMLHFENEVARYIKKVKRKDDTIKIYCSELLGEYKINSFEISEFLFSCINTKSVYLRVSALKSIAKIGNINNFIKALMYISNEDKYVNNKILVDILDQFGGDKILLNKLLLDNFLYFNENIQKTVIDYFKNNETISVQEDMLNLLKSDYSNKEVKISIIKYFSSIKYDDAKNEIIKILKLYDWEYRAICASTLGNYKDEDSIEALLISIGDKNWHVRYNSAISLLRFEEDYIVDKVLRKNDKYSKDILFYALFMKNKISFEEYSEIPEKIERNIYAKANN